MGSSSIGRNTFNKNNEEEMTTKQNKGTLILGFLLAFAIWQQNATVSIQQQSIMDTILPSGTGIEKMFIWWIGIGIITLLVVQSFYWKGK